MSHRSRKILPLVLAALLAVAALTGCGGGTKSEDAAGVLGSTFSNQRPIKSGRLNLSVTVRGASVAGLPSPFELALGGPFASNPGGRVPKFQFDLTVGTSAGKLTIGAVSTGAHGWIQIGGKAFALPDSSFTGLGTGRPSGATGATGPSGLQLSDIGVDPRRWLTDPKVVGTATLAGDRVTHVSSGVDVGRLLDDLGNLLGSAGKLGLNGVAGLGSTLSPASRAKLEQSITAAHVDVWSGEKDRLLRRITIVANVKDAGGKPGRIRLQLSLASLNKPQPIGPPANPRPLSELTSALGALAATRGAAGTETTPKAPTAKTYDACITDAGTDLARAQACSDLLGR
jgi:hypothetical protein